VEQKAITVLAKWTQTLDAMEPNLEEMSPLEAANYHQISGRARKAKEILESLASGGAGLTEDTFRLLLRCQVLLGLREEYRDTHRRYGHLFGAVHPDFNRLNDYLKCIDDSVFMIWGSSDQTSSRGSGFSVAPNLIVSNRHVVEKVSQERIEVISSDRTYQVERMELDPINNLAVLEVEQRRQKRALL
jgi:S1-C subfamily serine protease